MKKEQDKWAENLRIRMKDFSESPSEDLWNRIEKDLSEPHVLPFWRTRRFAVAAAIAAVAVSSVSVWFVTSSLYHSVGTGERDIAENIVVPSVSSFMDNTKLAETNDLESDENMQHPKKELLALGQNNKKITDELLSSALTESLEAEVAPVNDKESLVADPAVASKKEDTYGVSEQKSWQKTVKANRRKMEQNRRDLANEKKISRKSSWSLGVSAGNTPSSSASISGTDYLLSRTALSGALLMASSPGISFSDNSTGKYEVEKNAKVDHKMPVSVGASVKWDIDEHWAVESGLYYTYLSSEVHNQSNPEVEERQKLHYIGIPLKLQRTLWKNRRWVVYASAGAMFEKCVKATRDISYSNGISAYEIDKNIASAGGLPATSGVPAFMPKVDSEVNMEYSSASFQGTEHTSFHVSRLQYSVSASVGAQFDLTKRIGLYMEPGAAYYFNDGSDVETIRKEHPLNFSFQMGIRFNVSR